MLRHGGVNPEAYWEYQPGEHVMTIDGFPGVVELVEDGPIAGAENYVVKLDNGMGGGNYSASMLARMPSSRAAAGIHLAAEDYPELGSILDERPDPGKMTFTAALSEERQAVDAEDHDEPGGDTPSSCSYCGSDQFKDLTDNGRVRQATCATCGGTMSAHPGAQWTPELIGDPSNHPSPAVDPRSGASVGAGAPGQAGINDFIDFGSRVSTTASGHLDLYHRTTPQAAEEIRRTKSMHSKENTGETYWSTFRGDEPDAQGAGYGTGVVHIRVPHHLAEIEDEFPSGEEHYRVQPGHLEPHHFVEGKRITAEDDTTTIPTRRVGFAGYIEGEKTNFPNHGDNPDWEDEQAVGQHTGVHEFRGYSGKENDFAHWHDKGEITHVPLRGPNVYATQARVTKRGVDTYLKDPERRSGSGRPNYPGNDRPIFVKHGGEYYTLDGHHRTTAAMLRGDEHVEGHVYDADKHGFPEPEWSPFSKRLPRSLEKYAALAGAYLGCGFDTDDEAEAYQHELDHHDDGFCSAPRRGVGMTAKQAVDPGAMLRTAARDADLGFHITASWADVQRKAKRIRAEGGVTIVIASNDGIGGRVKGDHGVYEALLVYRPGTKKVADWTCGCKWAAYAFDRSPAFSRFEGRKCSHALALQFEAQSQGMFGKEVHPSEPTSRERAIVRYDPASGEHIFARPYEGSLVGTLVARLRAEDADPAEVIGGLVRAGVRHRTAVLLWKQAEHEEGERRCPHCGAPLGGEAHAHHHGSMNNHGLYLRFGHWPADERSHNSITGHREEGVSVYDLDHEGEPMDPDPHYSRNLEDDEYNDSLEEMHGRVSRAEKNRSWGQDHPSETGHLVKGDMVGIGHDGEPLLRNVRRVGDWIDHRHHFIPGAEPHHLAREPHDDGYEPPGHHHAAKREPPGPQVSGVALKAHDTGRVLMLQRGLDDPNDPAAGTWEFPGGHHEEGDLTSLHAGLREWQEEVGQEFPTNGAVKHVWSSPNGVYQGHVVVIPSEKALSMKDGRVVPNPDDPKGDSHEQAAWWDPDHARKIPNLRAEVKEHTPWKEIAKASLDTEKTAAAWDPISNVNPQPGRGTSAPAHSNTTNPASTGWAASEDPDNWDNLDANPEPLTPSLGFDAVLHDEPEPALPTTYGDEDATMRPAEMNEDDLDPVPDDPPAQMVPDQDANIHLLDGGSSLPNSYHASTAPETQQVADIIATFQRTAAGQELLTAAASKPDDDIAAAAKAHLAKEAAAKFDFAEQQDLINEGNDGRKARNLGDLKIEGTHYELLEAALAHQDADPSDIFS